MSVIFHAPSILDPITDNNFQVHKAILLQLVAQVHAL